MSNVRCFDVEGGDVIGMVRYTANLDHWDGRNWTSGSRGHHLGVGKTKDGRFYACYGTQWEGEEDYAIIISEKEAKRLVLKHSPARYEELFGEPAPEL